MEEFLKKLSDNFYESADCKEHSCKSNRKNIKKIYKTDRGFKQKHIEQEIFYEHQPKMADCVIICEDDSINIVEILCGKLTYSELKDKKKQLSNCLKAISHFQTPSTPKINLVFEKMDTIVKKKITSNKNELKIGNSRIRTITDHTFEIC